MLISSASPFAGRSAASRVSVSSLSVARLAIAVGAAFGLASVASAQQFFVIMPAAEDTTSAIAAISADGSTIVGTTSRPTPFRTRAIVANWQQSLLPTILSPLIAGQTSSATSVSCDGSIIGGQSGSTSEAQGVLWRNGQIVPAGFLAPAGGPRSSLINAVSCDGTRIAGQAINAAGQLEGFYASVVAGVPGPMLGIGFVSLGPQNGSSVNALTADGRMVGRASWSDASGSGFDQFILSPSDGTGIQAIGLSQGFGVDDAANAVTPDGGVIVGAVTVPDGFGGEILVPSRVVLGGEGSIGVISALVPCEEGSGSATGVSADGRVMVGYNNCLGPNRAFVWDPVNGYRLIEDILRDAGSLPTGFSLTIATGISADGTVIVGNGVGPGFTPRGWVAVIPRTDASPCPECAADFDGNGGVDGGDLAAFFSAFEEGGECADVDANGGVDGGDLALFFQLFEQGGCDSGRK